MSDLRVAVSDRDHRRGPADSPVTLVAYCDFACPDCAEGYLTVKQLQRNFGDKLSYVYRNFPLTDLHPSALCGARFAEAADKQGQFWNFHDFVYENQYLLDHPHRLLDEVTALGLDVEWMRRDVADKAFDVKIQDDLTSGKESEVTATPTYFINGARWTGGEGYADLSQAIDSELSKSNYAVR